MISDEIAEVFEKDTTGKANVATGYTYSGHPTGAASAVACIKETLRLNVVENAAARGTQLFNGLNALKEKYDIIGDVRGGEGLMCGIEFASDPDTKAPLDGPTATKIQETIYNAGVMARISGPNMILSPALVISEGDINAVLAALETGFKAA